MCQRRFENYRVENTTLRDFRIAQVSNTYLHFLFSPLRKVIDPTMKEEKRKERHPGNAKRKKG